jgi:uncharacterized protein
MNTVLLCAAALVLLYAALSLNVSRMRLRKHKFPEVTEAEPTKAIRAHGNASEYIPLFVVLLLYMNSTQASPYLAAVAVLATVSRFLHAAGMLRIASVAQRHPFLFYGALGTYACLFALGGALLVRAI